MADTEAQEQAEKGLSKDVLLKEHKLSILDSHMPFANEQAAVEICLQGVHKFKQYKDIAAYIKHEYDRKYPSSGKATEGVYHCICGKNFACAVSHEMRYYIHLQIDTLHIILFKSKDNPFAVSDP